MDINNNNIIIGIIGIIILILLFICCLYVYQNKTNAFKKLEIHKTNKLVWIDTNLYPEVQYFFENRDIIKNELMNILKLKKWSRWLSYDVDSPTFTDMTDEEIKKKLSTSYSSICEKNDGSWKLFGLILNKEKLETSFHCPKTIEIFNRFPSNVLNVGFSLLEPGGKTMPHKGTCDKFYRLHIPMIIPQSNTNYKNKFQSSILNNSYNIDNLAYFEVEGNKRIWVEDEYFMFDDLYMHNAINNTNEIRIVLLVDLLKK